MSPSVESVQRNACVHRLDLGLYSRLKEFWGNGVRAHLNSKRKIPSTVKILLRGGSKPQHCIKQDSEPNILPTSYSCSESHIIATKDNWESDITTMNENKESHILAMDMNPKSIMETNMSYIC